MDQQELKKLKYLRRIVDPSEADLRERERLEQFIEQIPDEVTRDIFRLHYAKGWTWQRVATFYGWKDESWPRKLAKKIFQ